MLGARLMVCGKKILTDYKFNNTPLLRQHVLSAATIHPFINAQKCWFMYPLLFNTGHVVLGDQPNSVSKTYYSYPEKTVHNI